MWENTSKMTRRDPSRNTGCKREDRGHRKDKNLLVERCSDGGIVDGGWGEREVSKCSG